MWDEETSTEKPDTPLSSINFFNTRIFLKTWTVLQKIFLHYQTKRVEGNSWFPLLGWPLTFYPYRSFLENRRHSWWNFSYWFCEAKFSRQNLMPPVLCIKIVGKKFKHRGFPQRIFPYCDPKEIRRKNAITSSLVHSIVLLPEKFWSTKAFRLNFFGNVRPK